LILGLGGAMIKNSSNICSFSVLEYHLGGKIATKISAFAAFSSYRFPIKGGSDTAFSRTSKIAVL
jgi:hypothetical protein